MKISFFAVLCITVLSVHPKPFYLIIHGTWCRPFSWHMPGGDFHTALTKATDPISVSFFIWSGENSHAARLKAAEQLVEHIALCVPPDAELHLITHSHGSNVGILASHIMAKQPDKYHKIAHFWALGTPVSTTSYFPDMNVITYFYNMFSFSDMVQPVFGIFKREFPKHERIANICVMIDGQAPSHSNLHSPIIAHWLPQLPTKFTYENPGIIHFYKDKPPVYEIDKYRTLRQQRDMMMLVNFKRRIVIDHSSGDSSAFFFTIRSSTPFTNL